MRLVLIALLLLGGCWLLTGLHSTAAQHVTAQQYYDEKAVLKVYYVEPLLVDPTDYRWGTPLDASANAPFDTSDRSPTPQELADALIREVVAAIAPHSWNETGGIVGNVIIVDGQMFVTQTPTAQKQIATFLDALERARSHQVRVSAHWLLASPEMLDKVLKPVAPQNGDRGQDVAMLAVSGSDLAEIEKKVRHFEAQTLGLDHHRAMASTALRLPRPIPAEDGSYKWQYLSDVGPNPPPVLQTTWYTTRLGLDALPFVDVKSNSAALIVSSRLLDASTNDMQQISTTVRVPLGRIILVGSSTLHVDATKANGPRLYFFIQVNAE